MSPRLQLSLPGFRPGPGSLFPAPVLERYLSEHDLTALPGDEGGVQTLREWVSAISDSTARESTLDLLFFEKIMCGVLGYVSYPLPPGSALKASLYAKPPAHVIRISGKADAVLGDFSDDPVTCSAVVELKSPRTDLDRPQPGHANLSPVDQAFVYARQIFPVRWVIVSDMRVIRLYSVDSQDDYEQFDLALCVGDDNSARNNLRRLHLLLNSEYLTAGFDDSQVSRLYEKSWDQRIQLRTGFYDAYCDIRSDLYQAIREASKTAGIAATDLELLQATQRLLDRLVFMYYCEDHPQKLIQNDTIKKVTEAASFLPGLASNRVYDNMKALFREVDVGSRGGSGLHIPAYNGELFKDHPILDHIELPDTLHKKTYRAAGSRGRSRSIDGVWGLYVYDFWTELNQHLMGHIFEESLSDLDALVASGDLDQTEKWKQRKRHGVFYTTDILSDFITRNVLRDALEEHAPMGNRDEEDGAGVEAIQRRLDVLSGLKIVDLACGSGAFLVSAYREVMREFWRLSASKASLLGLRDDLLTAHQAEQQSDVIRDNVFGVDILPQAVEIAKLALWLSSVRKDQPVNDLSQQVISADSLDIDALFKRLQVGEGAFDLVIGNPPWGAVISPEVRGRCVSALGISADEPWDSWELFLLLAIRALRDGGRLALLLPDHFFALEKAKTRKALFESTTVEMAYSLGPDWFGNQVRVGTIALQARRGPVKAGSLLRGMILSGELRRDAIAGKVPLTQVEALRNRFVPQQRTLDSPSFDVEVFRGVRDDGIMSDMQANSLALFAVCDHARGDEMNKAGLAWRCASCGHLTTPGAKRKGGGYRDKACPSCTLLLTDGTAQVASVVEAGRSTDDGTEDFIDGDDMGARYASIQPTKHVVLDMVLGPKPVSVYAAPKVLIREAGVGLSATLDYTTARCPRSVYIYRLRQEYLSAGYRHEFVLAALLSRAMNYFVLKRYGETDPAKAFAKLRMEHIDELPIPRVDFTDAKQARGHRMIVENVRLLLDGSAKNGGSEDLEIESILRGLWGISPEDGAYINGEFFDLPQGQVLLSLFPGGPPAPVRSEEQY